MINRILIRVKVVQMLYSYLLTRSEFRIDPAPESSSQDKKFAYAVYLDLLLLILEASGINTRQGAQSSNIVVTDPKLANSKLARALASDSEVRRTIFKGNSDIDALRPLAQHVHDIITASSAFKVFSRRRKTDLGDEVDMLSAIIDTHIANDDKIIAAFRALPGYTNNGFKAGIAALNATFRSYYGASAGYANACNALEDSLDKAYELYHSMLVLMIEITKEQERRIENARAKYLASSEERNPNMRFAENQFIAKLKTCSDLNEYLKISPISWETDIALVNSLLDKITSSKIYEDYMSAPATNFTADCDFWRSVLKNIVFPSDDLADALEEKSVYWNDDLQIIGTFVMKTIKQSANTPEKEIKLLPQYKDDEDARFGNELFTDAIKNRETYRSYIDRLINVGNWDPERIAFMDIVIMTTAISELINYPAIPLAVTMNEYVEIANTYSSAKSGQFINGILYNVVNILREEGKTNK
jgi:N utilization substance protein B